MPTTNTQTPSVEAVLDALKKGPASAAEIAEAASLGRSTATKVLAALVTQGRVARRAGGRDGSRRLPDRWSLAAPGKGSGTRSRRSDLGLGAAARLGKGELAQMALAHLRSHPGEHSQTAVAKALDGRSSGAVANALDRLVAAGDAVQTSPTPKRYQATRRR